MKDSISFEVPEKIARSLERLGTEAKVVEVVGELRGGQLHLDAASLAELNQKFPGAHLSFVAVNAPFKSKDASLA
jgi:hypothetical protein